MNQLIDRAEARLKILRANIDAYEGNPVTIAVMSDLLAALHKAIEWQPGPPTGLGRYDCEENGTLIFRDYRFAGPGQILSGTRHFRIPDPPPREPVVECCEFGRDCIRRRGNKWIVGARRSKDNTIMEYWIETCRCGTPLPELPQGD